MRQPIGENLSQWDYGGRKHIYTLFRVGFTTVMFSSHGVSPKKKRRTVNMSDKQKDDCGGNKFAFFLKKNIRNRQATC